MLIELESWLDEHGIRLVIAELKDPVRDKVRRYDLARSIDDTRFFPTLDDAVAAYRQATSAQWEPGDAPSS